MRRQLASAAAIICLACDSASADRYFASLSGDVVVPPALLTPASGQASFRAENQQLSYDVTLQTITGVTDVRIHAGAAGVNGPLIADLYSAGPSGTITSGTIAAGDLVAASVAGMSIESLLVLMRAGNAYIQVDTQAYPNGELRGQIHAN